PALKPSIARAARPSRNTTFRVKRRQARQRQQTTNNLLRGARLVHYNRLARQAVTTLSALQRRSEHVERVGCLWVPRGLPPLARLRAVPALRPRDLEPLHLHQGWASRERALPSTHQG